MLSVGLFAAAPAAAASLSFIDTGTALMAVQAPNQNTTAGLSAPTGLAVASSVNGGILVAGAYYYKVTATDLVGETTPSAPVAVTILEGATNAATLSWTDVAGASRYNVYRSATLVGPYFLIGGIDAPAYNTLIGGGTVDLGSVSVTFASVTANGNTTATPLNPCPSLPSDWALAGGNDCYDISTTASYTADSNITICFAYGGDLTPPYPVILHFTSTGGTDYLPTTLVPGPPSMLCVTVTSLSPFVIVRPVPLASTGTLCVSAFNDLTNDGQQNLTNPNNPNSLEPFMVWPFTITGFGTNSQPIPGLASLASGVPNCWTGLPAGTYTVHSGTAAGQVWAQTAPLPLGLQPATISIATGVVSFVFGFHQTIICLPCLQPAWHTGTSTERKLAGPFSSSTKIQKVGQYITWKMDGGPAIAGRTIQIWVAKKTSAHGTWSKWTLLATRRADATGAAYVSIITGNVQWMSIRPVLPAMATTTAAWGPSSIGRWVR